MVVVEMAGDWWLIGDEFCVLGLEPAKPRASPALAQAGPYRSTHPPEPENSHEHLQPQTQQIWSMERSYLLLLPCTPYLPFQDSPVPVPILPYEWVLLPSILQRSMMQWFSGV
ncbi:predicted protein [Histoplasma capsulatum G186AR]|uniref:Uncharacterized protein n=1 Tax=Ajellomyces capsulatus (strain G186AR / H82 / ATCC MYA-2454 / RMSCC 2432) TaxID=447093 RepID=C0NUP5_AJECG|nr:uncharacterized protein HCBG_06659 [Histoplasma capsulatum G186AR]EEH04708.1 predicted protein [Histoplasma capsulatum G186AR]